MLPCCLSRAEVVKLRGELLFWWTLYSLFFDTQTIPARTSTVNRPRSHRAPNFEQAGAIDSSPGMLRSSGSEPTHTPEEVLKMNRAAPRLVLLLSLFAIASRSIAGPSTNPLWIGSWAASQQIPEPQNALPAEDTRDATLRQVVHLSVGGTRLRIHLSNAFGASPLNITAAAIAVPAGAGTGSILAASNRALLFHGAPGVTIPPGAEYLSDPIPFVAAPLSDLAVTLHFDALPAQQTGHPGSRATSFLVHGDTVAASEMPLAKKIEHWYMLAGVDVEAADSAYAIVALGDSITDGHAARTDRNERWTDELARRLQASAGTRSVGVLNQGIGGNHLLTDGLGPNVLARFDRDVLAQAGAKVVIVFEGVNDLGALSITGPAPQQRHAALVERILGAYEQMIERAHAQGLRILGATITPFVGSDYYHPNAENEADRQAINRWIRQPGHFDAVIDFDLVTADPQHPDRLVPRFDSGDHLHPSPMGYKAMGDAVPLKLLIPLK
jgi:lysophospholipase L1-like esterase